MLLFQNAEFFLQRIPTLMFAPIRIFLLQILSDIIKVETPFSKQKLKLKAAIILSMNNLKLPYSSVHFFMKSCFFMRITC